MPAGVALILFCTATNYKVVLRESIISNSLPISPNRCNIEAWIINNILINKSISYWKLLRFFVCFFCLVLFCFFKYLSSLFKSTTIKATKYLRGLNCGLYITHCHCGYQYKSVPLVMSTKSARRLVKSYSV